MSWLCKSTVKIWAQLDVWLVWWVVHSRIESLQVLLTFDFWLLTWTWIVTILVRGFWDIIMLSWYLWWIIIRLIRNLSSKQNVWYCNCNGAVWWWNYFRSNLILNYRCCCNWSELLAAGNTLDTYQGEDKIILHFKGCSIISFWLHFNV